VISSDLPACSTRSSSLSKWTVMPLAVAGGSPTFLSAGLGAGAGAAGGFGCGVKTARGGAARSLSSALRLHLPRRIAIRAACTSIGVGIDNRRERVAFDRAALAEGLREVAEVEAAARRS
jgi:hypothetical protein